MPKLRKQAILDAGLRSILAAYPQLAPLAEDGKLALQLKGMLEHIERISKGNELSAEQLDFAQGLARELGQEALVLDIKVENLIQGLYSFRRAFWNELEKQNLSFSLHIVRMMQDYFSQVNLAIMQEYLQDERKIVAAQQTELFERQKKLNADLELARRIQQSMFPSRCEYRAFKLCAHIIPSGAVGGDFYGVLPFGKPEERVDLYIGDVQGKGIAAALIMMMINATLWDIASPVSTPKQIVSAVNRRFREHMTDDLNQFVSLFYLSYDIKNKNITYAKAGHEEGLLIRRKNGEKVTLSTPGCFMGIFDEMDLEEAQLPVYPGDRLYLFTDGVTVLGTEPNSRFEYEDFHALLSRYNSLPIDETLEGIFRELQARRGGKPMKDDVGIVVVEF